MLVSASEDRTIRFWDVPSGQQILQAEGCGLALRFSPDGRRLAAAPGIKQVGLYELAEEQVFREWPASKRDASPGNLVRSADSRFLLSDGPSHLYVWDTQARTQALAVVVSDSSTTRVFFSARDEEIIYSRRLAGVRRQSFAWTNNPAGGAARITLGKAEQVGPQSKTLFSVGADGRSWLVEGKYVELWPDGQSEKARVVIKKTGRNDAALSVDGRWAAAINYPVKDLVIWSTETGKEEVTLTKSGRAWFSPDGSWLIGGSPTAYRLWEVGAWQPGPIFPTDLPGREAGLLAFARGGRLVAVLGHRDSFHILQFPSGHELVRLEPPFALDVQGVAFSEDGSRLWVLGAGNRMFEWDLSALRTELAKSGLAARRA